PGAQRFEQHAYLTATALVPVRRRDVLVEREHEGHRIGGAGRQQLAGPVDGGGLEVPAPDAVPGLLRAHHHLRARLARGVPAHRREREEHPGHRRRPQMLQRHEPVHQVLTGSARAAATAQYTASGVAGLASRTSRPSAPKAATGARNASRTENASISGGSPTALEP